MEPSNPLRSRRRFWLRVLLALLAVAVLAGIFLHLRPQPVAAVRLAHLRSLGYPTSTAELATWLPAVADSNNLCIPIRTAAQALRISTGGKVPWVMGNRTDLPRGQAWPEDILAATRAYVTNNAEAFTGMAEILNPTRTAGRNPLNVAQGFSLLLPHLSEFKGLTQGLAAKAGLAAQEKQPREAVEAVRAQLAIARSLDSEPYVISQLVRIALDTLACTTIEHVVNRIELDDASLARLQQEFETRSELKPMVLGLVGEFCTARDALSDSANSATLLATPTPAGGPAPTGPSGQMGLYAALGFLRQDQAAYIEMMTDLIDIARLDPWKQVEPLQHWNQRLAGFKWYQGRLFTRMLLPAIANVTVKETTRIAQQRCTATALAILRYRHQHAGQLPAALTDLSPGLLATTPIDPFAGQPLHYEKRAGGFVVYSVGTNRADDHGRERSKGQAGDAYDLTFTLEGASPSPR